MYRCGLRLRLINITSTQPLQTSAVVEQPDSLPPPHRCFGLESLEDESTKHPPVMAEFGLAVGVFQLLDQGIKLAHTVASAKDAPGDIQTLLQDLKYLKNVLSEIFCVGKKSQSASRIPSMNLPRT